MPASAPHPGQPLPHQPELNFHFISQERTLLQAQADMESNSSSASLAAYSTTTGSARLAPVAVGASTAFSTSLSKQSTSVSTQMIKNLLMFVHVCAWFEQCLGMICAWFAHDLHRVWAMVAHGMRNGCARFAQWLCKVCAWFVQWLHMVCAMVEHNLSMVCTMFVQTRNVRRNLEVDLADAEAEADDAP
jgi:hypothetical protein